MKSLSINSVARIFAVDRSSIYAWIRRGLPHVPAKGPGRPAQLIFTQVLKWRLGQLECAGYTEDVLDLEASRARANMKAHPPRRVGHAR